MSDAGGTDENSVRRSLGGNPLTGSFGGSLDQALQRATTEMARWLENDYKLNSTESAMVLGFAVIYDVADLVGTQVSIVAKIPKTVLAQLKR